MSSQPSSPPPSSLFDLPDKANENELPSYRSVSPMAVLSSVLGVASILCFVDPDWLFLPALAFVAGLLAFRKIHKFPEIATGQSYAQAGVALALICGLGSVTYAQVGIFQTRREITRCVQSLIQALNDRDLKKATFLMVPPEALKDVPPQEVDKEVEKVATGVLKVSDARETAKSILAALANPSDRVELESVQDVKFVELEATGIARLTVGPAKQTAVAAIRSGFHGRGPRSYYVEVLRFPVDKDNKVIGDTGGPPGSFELEVRKKQLEKAQKSQKSLEKSKEFQIPYGKAAGSP